MTTTSTLNSLANRLSRTLHRSDVASTYRETSYWNDARLLVGAGDSAKLPTANSWHDADDLTDIVGRIQMGTVLIWHGPEGSAVPDDKDFRDLMPGAHIQPSANLFRRLLVDPGEYANLRGIIVRPILDPLVLEDAGSDFTASVRTFANRRDISGQPNVVSHEPLAKPVGASEIAWHPVVRQFAIGVDRYAVIVTAERIVQAAIEMTTEPEFSVDDDGALSIDLRLSNGLRLLAELPIDGTLDVGVYDDRDASQRAREVEYLPAATADDLIALL